MKIGSVNINGPAVLAPMAGITDGAFRAICAETGAALVYSEMVSAKSLSVDPYREDHLRHVFPSPVPKALQVFGYEADLMAEMAVRYSGAFDLIDINMGCPAHKIVQSGQGSALLKTPEKAREILTACVQAANAASRPLPVTVKIRKGWDADHLVAEEFAQMAQECGAAAITVHGRTREQFYSGKADWEVIARIKELIRIPVIGNGDVFTAQDALSMLEQTKCDLVMVGRGALGNPFIFAQINAAVKGESIPAFTWAEKAALLERQSRLLEEIKGEHRMALEMRKHAAWYLKGLPFSAALKKKAFELNNMEDILAFTKELAQRDQI